MDQKTFQEMGDQLFKDGDVSEVSILWRVVSRLPDAQFQAIYPLFREGNAIKKLEKAAFRLTMYIIDNRRTFQESTDPVLHDALRLAGDCADAGMRFQLARVKNSSEKPITNDEIEAISEALRAKLEVDA